jgi:hypothetical protein
LRKALDVVPQYHARQQRKVAFLGTLYALRVYLLALKPTTKRHILGQPLEQNFSALEDLVRLARASGARVIIYNAPVNPAVTLFYDDEYRSYLERLHSFATREGCSYADFSTAVPEDEWGFFIDGADPIHFDEHAHQRMGALLEAKFGPQLVETPRP